MKKVLFFFFLYFSIYSFPQHYTLAVLDSITTSYKKKGEFEKALRFNIATQKQYKEQNNREGIAATYINMANTLSTFDEYQESLHYLEKAKEELSHVHNKNLEARIYSETGRNYTFLGLYRQSNIQLNKAIEHLKDSKPTKQNKYSLYFSYLWKWYNFEKINQKDSIKSIRKISLKLFSDEPLVYIRIADRFLVEKKHTDSIEYYLDHAMMLDAKDDGYIHTKAIILMMYGDLYTLKKEYSKALDFYLESLPIYLKIDRDVEVRDIYKKISTTYKELGETEEYHEYLAKYTDINEHVQAGEKLAVASVINKLAAEKEKESHHFYTIILCSGILVLIFILIAIFIVRRIRKKKAVLVIEKDKEIEERNTVIEHKDKLLEKKNKETKHLKKITAKSIADLERMAKESSPFFISHFKGIYGDFYEKLIIVYPELTKHDIKFLAYMKMNLTNKEIGQIGNVTIRAVETKKYRLKKKFNLLPETDLNEWVKQF